MSIFYLVRHGETEWNRVGKIQGISDIPLNDRGREQATILGTRLRGCQIDLIGTSPLSRAQETAQILAAHLDLGSPVVIPELIERNYGEAEGSNGSDFYKTYPNGLGVAGREPKENVEKRAIACLRDLASSSSHNHLLVAHGAVIRSMLEHCDPGHSVGKIPNCSVHKFSMKNERLVLKERDINPESFPQDAD